MIDLLNYIVWNPDLEAFHLGPIAVRWYGLMWIIGLALAYFVVQRLYKEQKIKDEYFDPLFIYCFFGILMIALYMYVRKTKLSIWTVLDNIAIATGTTACFIRLGNLMNSEIIGKVTDVPWAFIFEHVDKVPRHPGQLYEAIAYAILFCIMWVLHKKMPERIGTGWYFGFCLVYIFTFRFLIEYTKEIQEAFEASLPLDMGQILSIPFVIIGAYCMIRAKKLV